MSFLQNLGISRKNRHGGLDARLGFRNMTPSIRPFFWWGHDTLGKTWVINQLKTPSDLKCLLRSNLRTKERSLEEVGHRGAQHINIIKYR